MPSRCKHTGVWFCWIFGRVGGALIALFWASGFCSGQVLGSSGVSEPGEPEIFGLVQDLGEISGQAQLQEKPFWGAEAPWGIGAQSSSLPAEPLFLKDLGGWRGPCWQAEDGSQWILPSELWGWSQPGPLPLNDREVRTFRRLRYRWQLRAQTRLLFQEIREDYKHFYSWPTFRDLGLGLALGAVFANTSLDEHFQQWYQEDVSSEGLDDLSSFWKPFGNGWIFVSSYAGLGLMGLFCPRRPVLGGLVGEFGQRVSRAYLVGSPPLLFLQAMTGGSRPVDPAGSAWRPFQDTNGLSGHAFIGAVPFITAAQMTDRPLLQALFYVGSVFPVWSRLNDDGHYLSQVALGWWLAYLACRTVHQTETGQEPWRLVPMAGGNQIGIGLLFTR